MRDTQSVDVYINIEDVFKRKLWKYSALAYIDWVKKFYDKIKIKIYKDERNNKAQKVKETCEINCLKD